jgi:hypothetical protein
MHPSASPRIELRLVYGGGREPQLTILGTEQALETLASSLQDALRARKEEDTYWGHSLATGTCAHENSPLGIGAVHFAVDSEEAPRTSSPTPAFGTWWAASLALVGAASLFVFAYRLVS